MQDLLIHEYTLRLAPPACNPGAGHYHVFVDLVEDISEVMPYLHRESDCRSEYYHRDRILIWMYQDKRYAFRPQEIGIAPVADSEEAYRLAADVVGRINDVWNRREHIKPDYEMGRQLPDVLGIYKRLPGTNCRQCGFPTCMAFAVALRNDEGKTSLCPYIL